MPTIWRGVGDRLFRLCELPPSDGVETVVDAVGTAVFSPFGPTPQVDEPGEISPLQVDGDGNLYVKISGTVQTAGGGGIGAIDTENLLDQAPVRFPLAPGNEQTRDIGDPLGCRFVHPHPPWIWKAPFEFTLQQTDTELHPAPGPNYALYITDVYLQAQGSVHVHLREAGGALLLPFYATQSSDGLSKSFRVPIPLAEDAALTITTSAGQTIGGAITGFVSWVGAF